ncbi:hypothetical protein LSAT2_026006, partial [Lamellibrachia satsuma]
MNATGGYRTSQVIYRTPAPFAGSIGGIQTRGGTHVYSEAPSCNACPAPADCYKTVDTGEVNDSNKRARSQISGGGRKHLLDTPRRRL